MRKLILIWLSCIVVAVAQDKPSIPDLPQLKQMAARFAPSPMRADLSVLSAADKNALSKLVEAARVVDRLFLQQLWSGNPALYQKLQQDKTPLGLERLHYFWMNK